MYRCKSCNISTELFFCPNCGLVLKYPQFLEGNKNQKDRLQSYIKAIVRKALLEKVDISSFSDKDVLTNAIFSKFNEHILFLQEESDNITATNNNDSQSLISLLEELVAKCQTKDCHIAVSGKIGAGKSTLISALLGNIITFTSICSETTVLTKYRYSEQGNYIKLSYYKTDEWDVLWESVINANQNSIRNDHGDYLSEFNRLSVSEIKAKLLNQADEVLYCSSDEELQGIASKYMSCESPYHYFVKEVEIGLTVFSMPKNVVIVNALGIDDPVSYRIEHSNKYLVKSDVILLCIKADKVKLSSDELNKYADLLSLIKHKQQIYVIGTQYDIPKDFIKYWDVNTSPEFIKCFSTKSYYNSGSIAEDRLLYVSAWYYNIIHNAKNDVTFWEKEYNVDYLAEVLCRTLGTAVAYQYGIDANSLKRCMEEHFDKIESMTNLPNVSNCIVTGPIRDFDRQALRDLKNIYLNIHKRNAVYSSNYSSHSSMLTTRMIELDSIITRKHNEDELKSKSIKKLIQSLEK